MTDSDFGSISVRHRGYAGAIRLENGVFTGRVTGLRDVVTFKGATFPEADKAFRASVDDYLAMCAERGEVPDNGRMP